MRYTVVLMKGEAPGRYVAYVPAIPGCVTQGESLDHAIARAADAASAMLAVMAEDGEELPTEEPGTVIASIEATTNIAAEAVA